MHVSSTFVNDYFQAADPHPVKRTVSCSVKGREKVGTHLHGKKILLTWGFKPVGQGEKVKGLVYRSDDKMIRWSTNRLFGVVVLKYMVYLQAFLLFENLKDILDHIKGTVTNLSGQNMPLFLITHDLWYPKGQECVYLCVCLCVSVNHSDIPSTCRSLLTILENTSHYSQTFRTIVPLFWRQHASIMMYISVLKHLHDPSHTGVYNKYWKLACLHSYIFRNV